MNKNRYNAYGKMILGKDKEYSLDCYQTKLNNNVLVIGTPGSGKTEGIVKPNILEAEGSYIIADPKGNLYGKFKDYLETLGYDVKKLDFTKPEESSHYNPLAYITEEQDIVKVAHMLSMGQESICRTDPFWDYAASLLLQALIAYICESRPLEKRKMSDIYELVEMCEINEDSDRENALDMLFKDHEKIIKSIEGHRSFAVKQYKKFRIAAGKTLKSILITLNAKLGSYDTSEINEMTSKDDIDIAGIGQKKTAAFVVVSDTDRSLDGLANVFYSQSMNELCRYADTECENQKLPVPVRFILDDFATNVCIHEFPRMISSIRSRGISAMIIIQAESQLRALYKEDANTVICGCDTIVYLGGNDVDTAKAISERCNQPLNKVLNMPISKEWIFRRGELPAYIDKFDSMEKVNELLSATNTRTKVNQRAS